MGSSCRISFEISNTCACNPPLVHSLQKSEQIHLESDYFALPFKIGSSPPDSPESEPRVGILSKMSQRLAPKKRLAWRISAEKCNDSLVSPCAESASAIFLFFAGCGGARRLARIYALARRPPIFSWPCLLFKQGWKALFK